MITDAELYAYIAGVIEAIKARLREPDGQEKESLRKTDPGAIR